MWRIDLDVGRAESDEFLDLLKSKRPPAVAKARQPARSAESCSPETAKEVGSPPAESRFRARVKQSNSTRTRMILVFAESAEDAAEKAEKIKGG